MATYDTDGVLVDPTAPVVSACRPGAGRWAGSMAVRACAVGVVVTMLWLFLGVHRCNCECLPVCRHVLWMHSGEGWCSGCGGDHAVVVLDVYRYSCECLPVCRQVGWKHGREGAVGVVVTMCWLFLGVHRSSCQCLPVCRKVRWMHGREGRCSGCGGDHAVVVFGCAQVRLSVFARVQEGVMDGP